MPPAYKEAQSQVREQLWQQWSEKPLQGPVALCMTVYGEGRGDTDNIAGAFMDSAQGIVFMDDRVSVIPELYIRYRKAKKAESKWVIHICKLQPQE